MTGKINKKTILALGWVSFFMDVSSEMIYPLLPIFMADTLGVGALTIGIVAGLSESIASFFRIFSGVLSDRVRHRKGLVLAGYSISAISRIVLALANSWGQVLGFRLLDRAGKGLRTPPRDALISDSATEETYGRYYGYHRAMDTAGAVLGPTIAFLVISSGYAMGSIFWLSLIPALLAVAILYIFVTEPGRIAQDKRGSLSANGRGQGSRPLGQGLPSEVKIFLFITAIFSLGNSSNFFIILKAKDLGFSAVMIPLLYISMNISYALFAYPAGRLADRYGKATLTFIGYFAYADGYGTRYRRRGPFLPALHFPSSQVFSLECSCSGCAGGMPQRPTADANYERNL
ncbi:MAG: hypothetical protein B6D63_05430 [Candidatus Latescibacteria bacterium 4484_7]|nr:MAG: hypothetical protein B6D63_05430 [Candidatus Latescibacteria bacterium 4484_7]